MRKITLLMAALAATFSAVNAQNSINNPIGADGLYIVQWDCSKGAFAASNNFEVSQTFTFAVDITGTPLEEWVKEIPDDGATRGIAVNQWTGYGDVNADAKRLKQISGNIYGATWNIEQMAAANFDTISATTVGNATSISMQVFGFAYTSDNPGDDWWESVIADPNGDGITPDAANPNVAASSLPYTGTRIDAEFYNDDYPGLFDASYGSIKGYTLACAIQSAFDESVSVPEIQANGDKVVGSEYYNLQGMRLGREPISGLYIKTDIMSSGKRVSTKVFKAGN